jgi:uncharacterized caspase-like protein
MINVNNHIGKDFIRLFRRFLTKYSGGISQDDSKGVQYIDSKGKTASKSIAQTVKNLLSNEYIEIASNKIYLQTGTVPPK